MTALDGSRPLAAPPARPRRRSWREVLATFVRRFALGTAAGLVLAGIVHIAVVLAIPLLSERDAGSAYMALGAGGRAELISGEKAPAGLAQLRDADPATAIAVCGYDLSNGPMRVVARAGGLPLGLTLHRRGGGVIYAITDRAAIRGVVEFLVMTEEQRDERLARDEEGETSRELRIVSDTTQGLIVARVLAKRASDRGDAEALATAVACGLAD
jgi:uncharacterized membrane protein